MIVDFTGDEGSFKRVTSCIAKTQAYRVKQTKLDLIPVAESISSIPLKAFINDTPSRINLKLGLCKTNFQGEICIILSFTPPHIPAFHATMSRRSTRQSLQATEKDTTPKLSEVTSRKRTRVTKSEPSSTKSHYFKPSKNNDDEREDLVESPDHTTGTEKSDSPEDTNYGDVSDHESTGSPDEDEYSDEQPKRKRKGSSTGATLKKPRERKIGHELWRAGAVIDAPPGTRVIIKKPVARPAGNTPYLDGTIHPNTLLFLKDLKANNDRG